MPVPYHANTMATEPAQFRIGDAYVLIDVNERHDPGTGFRDLIFRVQRARIVCVYRCLLRDIDVPGNDPRETAEFLLTQAHRRNLLFSYRASHGAPPPAPA